MQRHVSLDTTDTIFTHCSVGWLVHSTVAILIAAKLMLLLSTGRVLHYSCDTTNRVFLG